MSKNGGCQVVCCKKCFTCVCVCVCVFSITYVPAEYLEEYKTSLAQAKDDLFSEPAPVPVPDPKYVLILYPSNVCLITLRNRYLQCALLKNNVGLHRSLWENVLLLT